MAQRRNAGESSIALEIGLTLTLVLVAVGWSVRSRPFVLAPPTEASEMAPAPEAGLGADVLVVLPEPSTALTLDQWQTDQAWLNAIEQEVGEVRTVSASQLSRSVMDPVAWVIITRHAAAALDPTQTQFVRNWVEDGGVVMLEQPIGPWQGIVGTVSTGRFPEADRITSFDGALTHGDSRADVAQAPLHTTLMPYSPSELSRGRDYQVLLEVNGQPGLVERRLGRGRAYTLLFDLGRALQTAQQGLPDSSFNVSIPAEGPYDESFTHTAQLVADDRLRTARVPYMDLLERNLLYLADAHRPVGRLWLYPGRYRGALVVTHSEGGYGAETQFMPGWEHENEMQSSLFVVPGSLTPEGLARVGRIDGDIQLEWIPASHPRAPRRTWGVRRFRPFQRPMTIEEQHEALTTDAHPYGPPQASRSFEGAWPTGYFDAFGQLEALGIALDSSYSPPPAWMAEGEEEQGYMWGTGLPFRPIDASGNRYELYELPVTIDDRAAGYSLAEVRRFLVDAADRYHTTVVGNWHPNTMAVRPSFDALEGWRQSFELAASQDLWVTTMADYVRFMQARAEASIDSSFSREERRLSINFRSDADAAFVPGVAFLARYEGRPIERITVDSERIEITELPLSGDRMLHMLPMTPGQHHIEVYYATPSELIP